MDIPTEYKPSVFHRELQKNYGILPHSPTDFHGFSDGITDGLSHACLTRVRLHKYRPYCRRLLPTDSPTDHPCLTRVRLHHYRRNFRRHIPMASPTDHACLTRVSLHHYRRRCLRIEKFGGIFELFWCAFQLIFDGITDGI